MRVISIFCLVCVICLIVVSVSAAGRNAVTLVHWDLAQPASDPLRVGCERTIAAFEKQHPHIKIKVERYPYPQYYDKVTTAFVGRKGPDVLRVANVDCNATWAKAGMLLPLDDYIKWSFVNPQNYFKIAWTPTSYQGKVYGLPHSIDNRALAYNQEMFNAVGVQPPTDWEEMLKVSRALTRDTDGDGTVDEYAFGIEGGPPDLLTYRFGVWLVANDGWIVNKEGTKALCDQKESVEAVEFWLKLADNYAPPGAISWREDDVTAAFCRGTLAMFIAGPWWLSIIPDRYPEMKLGRDWNVTLIPGPNKPGKPQTRSGSTSGGWNWSIWKTTKHPDECWEFIEFTQIPRYHEMYTDALPCLKAAANLPRFQTEQYQVFVEELEYSRVPVGIFPEVLEIYDLQGDVMEEVLMHVKSPQEAMVELAEKINALLKK